MSQDLAPCDMAWQSPSYQSAPAGRDRKHPCHPNALSASGGLVISTTWTTVAFPKDYFMASCPQASTHLEDRSCAIKTHWRRHLSNAEFPIPPAKNLPRIVLHGVPSKNMLWLTLKVKRIKDKEQNGRERKTLSTPYPNLDHPCTSPVPTVIYFFGQR